VVLINYNSTLSFLVCITMMDIKDAESHREREEAVASGGSHDGDERHTGAMTLAPT
jgi:hypothetical protein